LPGLGEEGAELPAPADVEAASKETASETGVEGAVGSLTVPGVQDLSVEGEEVALWASSLRSPDAY
jgi:hypothetical protein